MRRFLKRAVLLSGAIARTIVGLGAVTALLLGVRQAARKGGQGPSESQRSERWQRGTVPGKASRPFQGGKKK